MVYEGHLLILCGKVYLMQFGRWTERHCQPKLRSIAIPYQELIFSKRPFENATDHKVLTVTSRIIGFKKLKKSMFMSFEYMFLYFCTITIGLNDSEYRKILYVVIWSSECVELLI